MNLGWPGAAFGAVGSVSDLLARLPEVESAVSETVARAQATLEEILARVRPVGEDLDELRATAQRLESHLERVESHLGHLERLIDPLEDRFQSLTESANRLDGDLIHVLDRIPGLSADKAREEAERPN